MKVGDGLGSEGTLSSVLKVQVCSRVSGYPCLVSLAGIIVVLFGTKDVVLCQIKPGI